MKTQMQNWRLKIAAVLLAGAPGLALGQINTGSNGSDGAFAPTNNTVINMSDHPNGIYQYTSVNIPTNVTVTLIPNANNSPVTWLVQSNCVINGTVDVSGHTNAFGLGGAGGPGGWAGGVGGSLAQPGQGPGGGDVGYPGSFGNPSPKNWSGKNGPTYGNIFLVPLLGGSGGGGNYARSYGNGGGGGGGAIFIAAGTLIEINGSVRADGGDTPDSSSGAGSGGGIRIATVTFAGKGVLSARGGGLGYSDAGGGRIRIDALQNNFTGSIWFGAQSAPVLSMGFQPIIIPAAGQGAQLLISSIAGSPVSPTPSGQLAPSDATISAQQSVPLPVVVQCSNLPLHTQITVSARTANGTELSAVGYNDTGTVASSTATIMITIPRGGGIMSASAAIAH